MNSAFTFAVCLASLVGLFMAYVGWEARRDAACQKWATVPYYRKGQACIRYQHAGEDLVCAEWLYQHRVCVDLERP